MSSYPGLEHLPTPGGGSWGAAAPYRVNVVGSTDREAVRRALLLKTTMGAVMEIPLYWGDLETWFIKNYLDDSPAGRTLAQACVQLPESTIAKVPLYVEGCLSYLNWAEAATFTGKVVLGKNPIKGGVLVAIVRAVRSICVRIIEVTARRLAISTSAKAAGVVPYIGWAIMGVAYAADAYLTITAFQDLWRTRENLVDAMLDVICPL